MGIGLNAEPRGIRIRPNRTNYSVTSFTESLAVAADLKTPDQVRNMFGEAMKRALLVVEVAVYPKDNRELQVRQSDFVLRIRSSRAVIKPLNLKEMQAELVEKTLPEVGTSKPVAGYLYFPIAEAEQSFMDYTYELEYTGQGAWLDLPLQGTRRH